MTRTTAHLGVTPLTFKEITDKMKMAGYPVYKKGVDMNGITIVLEKSTKLATMQDRLVKVVNALMGQKSTWTELKNATFNEMGFDSLDSVELAIGIEDEFDIEVDNNSAEQWTSMNDIIVYLNRTNDY